MGAKSGDIAMQAADGGGGPRHRGLESQTKV